MGELSTGVRSLNREASSLGSLTARDQDARTLQSKTRTVPGTPYVHRRDKCDDGRHQGREVICGLYGVSLIWPCTVPGTVPGAGAVKLWTQLAQFTQDSL